MAQRVVTTCVDDLTGEEYPPDGGETVHFGLTGVDYEIDLSASSAEKFREALAKYTGVARRLGRVSVTRTSGSITVRKLAQPKPEKTYDAGAIRMWTATPEGGRILAANGVERPNDRGRMGASLVELYQKAMRGEVRDPQAVEEEERAAKAEKIRASRTDALAKARAAKAARLKAAEAATEDIGDTEALREALSSFAEVTAPDAPTEEAPPASEKTVGRPGPRTRARRGNLA